MSEIKKDARQAWKDVADKEDSEIRDFVRAEEKRLGGNLNGFEITWCETEKHLDLILSSSAKAPGEQSGPVPVWGYGFCVAHINKSYKGDNDPFALVKLAGRGFWLSWKGTIEGLTRNLSLRYK